MLHMEFGVAIFPTHDAIRPGDIARLAEERGQGSLFFPEHTHMPASHTPHPAGRAHPRPLRGAAGPAPPLLAHVRPVRFRDGGLGGDVAAARRYRRVPGDTARS